MCPTRPSRDPSPMSRRAEALNEELIRAPPARRRRPRPAADAAQGPRIEPDATAYVLHRSNKSRQHRAASLPLVESPPTSRRITWTASEPRRAEEDANAEAVRKEEATRQLQRLAQVGGDVGATRRSGTRAGFLSSWCLWLILGYAAFSTVLLSGLRGGWQEAIGGSQLRPKRASLLRGFDVEASSRALSEISSPSTNGEEASRARSQSEVAPPAADENSDGKWWLGRIDTAMGHPYMGARHPNGSTHMLINPTTSRLATVAIARNEGDEPSEAICPRQKYAGIEGEGGRRVLDKARMGMYSLETAAERKNEKRETRGEEPRKRSRILCMVYSVHRPLNEDGSNANVAEHANLRAIAETWGRKCDGFIGASNFTDHSIGAVDLLHEGPEEYGNMWQKVRSMWAYAANYVDDYDFFHIIGDDSYVNVDNLRSYLDGDEVVRLEEGYMDELAGHKDFIDGSAEHKHIRPGHQDFRNGTSMWKDVRPRPLVFGLPVFRLREPLKANGEWDNSGVMFKMTFPAGGSGYTLNRAALQLLQSKGLDSMNTDIVDSREDVIVGGMFSVMGVTVSNTIDQKHGGRYLVGSAEDAYRRKRFDPSPAEARWMSKRFRISHGDGFAGVSKGAISFHLKDDNPWLARNHYAMADLIRRYHAVLYDLCPKKSGKGRTAISIR